MRTEAPARVQRLHATLVQFNCRHRSASWPLMWRPAYTRPASGGARSMRPEAGASGALVERSNRPVGHTPTRPEQDKGRLKNLARLGYEEEWQPYAAADEAGGVAAPERENDA